MPGKSVNKAAITKFLASHKNISQSPAQAKQRSLFAELGQTCGAIVLFTHAKNKTPQDPYIVKMLKLREQELRKRLGTLTAK